MRDVVFNPCRRLYESVHSQVFTLPEETLLYPAHDYKVCHQSFGTHRNRKLPMVFRCRTGTDHNCQSVFVTTCFKISLRLAQDAVFAPYVTDVDELSDNHQAMNYIERDFFFGGGRAFQYLVNRSQVSSCKCYIKRQRHGGDSDKRLLWVRTQFHCPPARGFVLNSIALLTGVL